jgi:3-dehydroquinate dehydratase-2
MASPSSGIASMRILILHGPNLNLLGRREPHIYGSMTLDDINAKLAATAAGLGIEIETFQSNHEGFLVDKLHENIDRVDGALVNPAGLTQFGVSLHDAIKAMPFPVLEVHVSNIAAREPWRDHSIISSAVKGTVQGLGWRSYIAALHSLVDLLNESRGGARSLPIAADDPRH